MNEADTSCSLVKGLGTSAGAYIAAVVGRDMSCSTDSAPVQTIVADAAAAIHTVLVPSATPAHIATLVHIATAPAAGLGAVTGGYCHLTRYCFRYYSATPC